MAWVQEAATVGGEAIDARVRRDANDRVEATVPWRPGLGPGALVGLADGEHRVVEVRDPGGRREILELALEPAGQIRTVADARPADEAERIVRIAEAIVGLDLSDPAHVTASGKPDATVLSELLGWRVSAEERDRAWDEVSGHE